MPYAYPSTQYYEDQKNLHDFYLDLGNQCRISEEKRQALRMCWGIVGRTDDERIRLQALALIDKCNSHKMDMVTNGKVEKLSAAADKTKTSTYGQEEEQSEEEKEGVF